ncbi:hypothetical protein PIB30_023167 [Stylosanthes scabra]|uniref:DUF1499 domain-containing protein n=1 Tax=Stylosanthes scabra TaxID=79078 RepID=A0ABU6T938_9FABA|nr:hypothetical protein [Stylosanthes scabra]
MASMAASSSSTFYTNLKFATKPNNKASSLLRISLCHNNNNHEDNNNNNSNKNNLNRRELILRSSEIATVGAIFNFGGKKPDYLGVQKNPPSLALCPATKNCISTSENISDIVHYAPPWNYNPESRTNPISKEEAIEELIDVIESTPADRFTPRIVERKEDYIRVEYSILGFVDDVEFWFPPGKGSTVEYRSASRVGNFDFDANKKRIKALRQELEKRGWASAETI